MTDPEPSEQRQHDLALLAAGEETGWWDDNGIPAPWPEDFFDDNSGWRQAGNDAPPARDAEQPPF
mgnify:CR=1 FL=1